MLKFNDFFHLPQIDDLMPDLVMDPAGLMVVAGLGQHVMRNSGNQAVFLPSSRATIFSIIFQEILSHHPGLKTTLIASRKSAFNPPRGMRYRMDTFRLEKNTSYEELFEKAIRYPPDLLLIDSIDEQNANLMGDVMNHGIPILAQIDTILWGKQILDQLVDFGLPGDHVAGIQWIITVQRLPTLCQKCRIPIQISPETFDQYRHMYPAFGRIIRPEIQVYQPGKCSTCRGTGRYGETSIFDVFISKKKADQSALSIEEYLLHQIAEGSLCLEDFFSLSNNLLRGVFNLLSAEEIEKELTGNSLNLKLTELEAAYRVLQKRTEVFISLQEFSEALISTKDIHSLGSMVCKRASELCGADRAILYFNQNVSNQPKTEVLAYHGWDDSMVIHDLETFEVFNQNEKGISSYNLLPPGIHSRNPKISNAALSAALQSGLRIPLIAQGTLVGLMIVHSIKRKAFHPGEIAILQTFANQSALALQRAGLLQNLQQKINELENAQVELVKKERMEQELLLARQVQQTMLPRKFPDIPRFSFSVKNDAARQVGGDFYDVIALDDQHFGIAIADVSDKGMPAALYMALTRSILVAEARRELSPKIVLERINSLLLELGEADNFVSIFYGVVNRFNGTMKYSRAGHERPYLLRDNHLIELGGKGSVLGILDTVDIHLSEETTRLIAGDLVFLFTDGVTDVSNVDGETFGHDRLAKLIATTSVKSSDEAIAKILSGVSEFQGDADPYDDMTLLVLRVDS